ncbi:acetyl esterase/lipase [Mumia flava]|uniref:Acetyl esterase/lipase n=1 Tax=Mumia flava TaxID=1348852 RepID=A0A0B2AW35_9ACTN|nr:alpha/beta hydrolase [Mumia flava]PJJ48171.1 acetyl esterase/lipase [Mumia flava]
MADRLPLRTRLFARIEGRLSTPIHEVPHAEIAARRGKRAALLSTPLARRLVSGRPHPQARIHDVHVDLPPVKVPGGSGLEATTTEAVSLRLRVYQPSGPRRMPLGVVLMLHGGGWVMGDPEQSEWWSSHLAVEAGCVVVSVAYRLAPEHPYPAAVLDAWAALDWVSTHAAEVGGDPDRIVVAGDSAGGNLAAVVAELAGRSGGPTLQGQVLVYPAAEMEEKYPSEVEFADAPVLTSTSMRAYSALYLAGADPQASAASPIRGDLAGAAVPALVQIAGHDPLRDNGTLYAEALRRSGGSATLTDYPNAVHGYLSLPGISPAAGRAHREIVGFVTDALRAG